MGTTTRGLPWPNGTDYVVNGDDAIRALAEKLDVVGTYTPGTTNVVLGNGTITGRWWAVGGALLGDAVLTFGSTTTVNSPYIAPPPAAPTALAVWSSLGAWVALDVSAGATRHGLMIRSGSTAAVRNSDGTSLTMSGTAPWVWAAGDQIIVSWAYPLSTVP
jgi:hypothetical protein